MIASQSILGHEGSKPLTGNQLQQDFARWLSYSDPFINYNAARDARHENTAVWFIQGSTFRSWKESTSLLWIYGKRTFSCSLCSPLLTNSISLSTAGAGKSVLSCVIPQFIFDPVYLILPNRSSIIEDIHGVCDAGSAYIGFFFFDFKDIGKQDIRALLSSLIIQLSKQSISFHNILLRVYSTHFNGTQQPSVDQLTKCLEDIVRAAGDVPTYLILDALDECPNTNGIWSLRDQVLALVEKLVKWNLKELRLCITSRPEIDIRTSLEPLTSPSDRISLHDQSGQKKDMVDFVKAVVHSDRNMRRWRDEDKELVIKTLSERADGM